MTPEQNATGKNRNEDHPKPSKLKKPYHDPAFRFEKIVFETMALRCGKIETTTLECKFHRNAS
jgi:hypothetical protein